MWSARNSSSTTLCTTPPCTACTVRYIPYMQLKDEDVREFQEIWKKHFGEEISEGYAQVRANQVMQLFLQLARPLPSEKKVVDEPDKRDSAPLSSKSSPVDRISDGRSDPFGTQRPPFGSLWSVYTLSVRGRPTSHKGLVRAEVHPMCTGLEEVRTRMTDEDVRERMLQLRRLVDAASPGSPLLDLRREEKPVPSNRRFSRRRSQRLRDQDSAAAPEREEGRYAA